MNNMFSLPQVQIRKQPHQVTHYDTVGYFVKDLVDAQRIKIARMLLITGCIFLLQTIVPLLNLYSFLTDNIAKVLLPIFYFIFIQILPIVIISRKLYKNRTPLLAFFTFACEIAIMIIILLLPYQNTLFLLSLFIPGVSFLAFGITRILMIKRAPPTITDSEFDMWVDTRAKIGLINTIQRLGLADEIRNPNDLLCVHGYVLPGMRNARYYNRGDLWSKQGDDGRWRYAVNVYTYFYPAEHQIMIFIYDINAMNWSDYREVTKEYFYEDVIGATTEDDQDTIAFRGGLYNYRVQRFSLRLCDGYGIWATVRSIPLDVGVNLPTFDVPEANVDRTIAQLRMLLRSKKGRGTQGYFEIH